MKPDLRALLLLALLVGAFLAPRPARAEENPPYYVVQPGDTLSGIAYQFGIDIQKLAAANGIADYGNLQVGQKLILPGLEGFHGEMTARPIAFGESLTALSRAYRIPEGALARLNHIVSPYQLFVGKAFILPAQAMQTPPPRRALAADSLMALALAEGQSPWALALANGLPGTWAALPGDVLALPNTTDENNPALALPSNFTAAIQPTAWVQGHTHEVRFAAPGAEQVSGTFGERPLHFFPLQEQAWVALQGVYALATPGLRPLQVQATLANEQTFAFEQAVPVVAGNYAYERLVVPASLLDPELNKQENEKFAELTAPATATRYWNGIFKAPEAPPLDDCHPSYFGTRRNYNDVFFWYHTGLDFCGKVGTPIYAPADGKVVFAGTTEIHGHVTIIDHGWGVYTTYCHQSEILVQTGQTVHTGDLIGKVGRTGRVTGPHLHWEVWVGNVPVDPMEWLQRAFP